VKRQLFPLGFSIDHVGVGQHEIAIFFVSDELEWNGPLKAKLDIMSFVCDVGVLVY
jgi:hypothetical protein